MTDKFKYPRTYHLQFSQGLQNDDRRIEHYNGLVGNEVVATLKYDGENTSLYADGLHARSMDSRHHASRDWIKQFHGSIAHLIPPTMRICGENMFARHSIGYENLKSYFYGFSVWEGETCFGWDETLEWFDLLGIEPVKVLYRGPFDLAKLQALAASQDPERDEGFVVRTTGRLTMDEFKLKFAKYVRKGHVQTTEHWMTSEIVPNGLAS